MAMMTLNVIIVTIGEGQVVVGGGGRWSTTTTVDPWVNPWVYLWAADPIPRSTADPPFG